MYTVVFPKIFIHIVVHLRPAPLESTEYNVFLIYKLATLSIKYKMHVSYTYKVRNIKRRDEKKGSVLPYKILTETQCN